MNSITPIQQRHSGKPGFPLRLFAAAFVISLLTGVFGGWQAWQMHNRFQERLDKQAHVTENIGYGLNITERRQAESKLAEQLNELRLWHDATLGREMRILDLKHEANELLGNAGQPPRYFSAESDDRRHPDV